MARHTHQPLLRSRKTLIAAIASIGLVLSACSAGSSGGDSGEPAGTPQAGGTLRVGVVGGSAKDTLDAHAPITQPDEARVAQLFDTLTIHDTDYKLEMALAEKISPSEDAKTWVVTLREDLKFSDGSPITAGDVVYTFKRITDPDDPKASASTFANLDRDRLRAKDDRTVIFPFTKPLAPFADLVASIYTGIVKKGYDPKIPVSSGPFVLDEFTPGSQSTFVRTKHYWRESKPYVDEVTIFDFPDDTARVNALLGGQVDAIAGLPLGQVKVIKADNKLKVLKSETGMWLPFTMRVDKPPFDDPKVRAAFRLIVDRKQMVKQVLDGNGTIGNDIVTRFDPCDAKDLPQREQNIDKAKRLLEEAGQSNLEVDLITSPFAAGIVEAAQVFAQQAKEAGVKVNVKKVDSAEFYGDQYLKWTFAQDYWFTHNYLEQSLQAMLPGAPYNETHWANKDWIELVDEAIATVDEKKRCELIKKAQKIEYDKGGYIVWGFPDSIDAHTTAVHGFEPDKAGSPLTTYGFDRVWLNK